jgi:hypothetical protein
LLGHVGHPLQRDETDSNASIHAFPRRLRPFMLPRGGNAARNSRQTRRI